jgi:hypothetical protein
MMASSMRSKLDADFCLVMGLVREKSNMGWYLNVVGLDAVVVAVVVVDDDVVVVEDDDEDEFVVLVEENKEEEGMLVVLLLLLPPRDKVMYLLTRLVLVLPR